MSNPKLPKKPSDNPFTYVGLAFQMGVTIYLFVWLGKKLDVYYQTGKLFLIIGTLTGVAISLYALLKQMRKL